MFVLTSFDKIITSISTRYQAYSSIVKCGGWTIDYRDSLLLYKAHSRYRYKSFYRHDIWLVVLIETLAAFQAGCCLLSLHRYKLYRYRCWLVASASRAVGCACRYCRDRYLAQAWFNHTVVGFRLKYRKYLSRLNSFNSDWFFKLHSKVIQRYS